jgi:hypothetical protein
MVREVDALPFVDADDGSRNEVDPIIKPRASSTDDVSLHCGH